MSPRPPVGDALALIANLREGDPEAISRAYRAVFGSELGRQVLTHIAAEAGVGRRHGGDTDLYSVGYHQGGHDVALEILARAGFDQASLVSMVLSGQLEGRDDERAANPSGGGYAEPNPELTD